MGDCRLNGRSHIPLLPEEPVIRLLLVSTAVVGSVAWAQPTEWKLDKSHSSVGFVARHLGFAKVKGRFTAFEASATIDPKTGRFTALGAHADAASVDTGSEKRDAHLRSPDFFAAAAHPRMSLKLKTIEWKGDRFEALVALTIRGVTRDVPLIGQRLGFTTVNFGGGAQLRTAYEATARINRRDFGLSFDGLAEGVSIVGDEVDLLLEASFWSPAL